MKVPVLLDVVVRSCPRFPDRSTNSRGDLRDRGRAVPELAPNQALVIEATPPGCDYWTFQLGNIWAEPLDYRFRRVHVNSQTTVLRAESHPEPRCRVVKLAELPDRARGAAPGQPAAGPRKHPKRVSSRASRRPF